jgi:formylglycine-generating enzyme required for sulfatase activity
MRLINLINCHSKIIPSLVLFILIIAGFGCSSLNKKKAGKLPIEGKAWNVQLPDNNLLPMNWISPGTFIMGSPESEKGRKTDENPQTTVTLTKGYWLGITEVTIGQWKAVTGVRLRDKVNKMLNDETLYDFEGGKKQKIRDYMHFDRDNPDKIMANEDESLPMYFVSWNEAIGFCQKLNLQEHAKGRLPAGYEYTLPTEAQWEYACRAGTTGATYALPENADSNDESLDGIAWYRKNSIKGYTGKGLGPTAAGPRIVGTKQPNKWHMYDMLGNIWEWCRDWYGPYPGGAVTDPVGPQTGTYRANRGGSWGSGISDERSANRAKNPPNEDSAYRGFRIALSAVR